MVPVSRSIGIIPEDGKSERSDILAGIIVIEQSVEIHIMILVLKICISLER